MAEHSSNDKAQPHEAQSRKTQKWCHRSQAHHLQCMQAALKYLREGRAPLGPMLMRVGSTVISSGWIWMPIASFWIRRGEIWMRRGLMLIPCSAKVIRHGPTLKSCSEAPIPVVVAPIVKGAFCT